MKRILICDCETTGVDATKDSIVEIGAILYDLEHACAIECWSSLVRCSGNAAAEINRIPAAALLELGEAHELEAVMVGFRAAAAQAEALVAYSAEFDRAFLEIANGGPFVREEFPGEPTATLYPIPWVCAMNDLQWPRSGGASRSLVALALAHDLGIGHAHRALADCDLLARLFTRARELGASLPAMMARGLRPKGKVIAQVSFEEREKPKAAGFQWDGQRKEWSRVMALEDVKALPFPTRVAS